MRRTGEDEEKGAPGPPLLTQPGPEAADRVAPSWPRAPSAVFLIKPEHVDSDHVLGAGAQSSGRVPWRPLGVLVPRQAVGRRGRGGGRVAAARVLEQQQKQQQQRQQLGPRSRAGPSGATGHDGWRRRRGRSRGRGGGGISRAHRRLRTNPAAGGRAGSTGRQGAGCRDLRGAELGAQPGARYGQRSRPSGATQSRAEPKPARCLGGRAAKLCSPRRARLGGFEGRGGAERPAAPSRGTRLRAPNHSGPPPTLPSVARPRCACARVWRCARAGVCAGLCAQSVGGVGVGRRAPRSPAESRRPGPRPGSCVLAPRPGRDCVGAGRHLGGPSCRVAPAMACDDCGCKMTAPP